MDRQRETDVQTRYRNTRPKCSLHAKNGGIQIVDIIVYRVA